MKFGNSRGFTLIEVIVVAAIISVLAGILVPLIFREIDEAKVSRSAADVKAISDAMIVFRKDTGVWPVKAADCNTDVTFLEGAGAFPAGIAESGFDNSVIGTYDSGLSSDANGCYAPKWNGPYMAIVNADPWGYRYVTNAANFTVSGAPVWIISAGPNGVLNTSTNDTLPCNGAALCDDIGVRLK